MYNVLNSAGDHQLPAEDWDPRNKDHRQGDGEGIRDNVSKCKTFYSIKPCNFFKRVVH